MSAEPPAFWSCPDCDFRAVLALSVYEHMFDHHRDDHPGETLGHDPETYAPRWEPHLP